MYSFAILGHFDELKRKLDEIDNKAYNDSITIINNSSNNNSSIDIHKKLYLDSVKKDVCRRDASGASIFHLAYLNKQYKIAQYLVARYPQWAYLPYDYSKLFKEHDKQNNHIEELYRLLGMIDE